MIVYYFLIAMIYAVIHSRHRGVTILFTDILCEQVVSFSLFTALHFRKRLRDSILSAFFHSYIFAMYKNEALWI